MISHDETVSDSISQEDIEKLKDPRFQELFQNLMENPELANYLVKLGEEAEKNPEAFKDLADGKLPPNPNMGFTVTPEPGFVLKTQIWKAISFAQNMFEKRTTCQFFFASCGFNCYHYESFQRISMSIFFCGSVHIPSPPLISDEEFQKALQTGDASVYRMPLSMAGPRKDVDKANNPCVVFDACVHHYPIEKATKDLDYRVFLVEVVMQYIEEKFNLELNREYTFPKMKSKGTLLEHHIKRQKRPMIKEMSEKEKSTRLPLEKPKFNIDELTDENNLMKIQIDLPKLTSVQDLTVDIETKKLVIHVPKIYQLELNLPREINIQKSEAEFHWSSKKLYVLCSLQQ